MRSGRCEVCEPGPVVAILGFLDEPLGLIPDVSRAVTPDGLQLALDVPRAAPVSVSRARHYCPFIERRRRHCHIPGVQELPERGGRVTALAQDALDHGGRVEGACLGVLENTVIVSVSTGQNRRPRWTADRGGCVCVRILRAVTSQPAPGLGHHLHGTERLIVGNHKQDVGGPVRLVRSSRCALRRQRDARAERYKAQEKRDRDARCERQPSVGQLD